MGVGASLASRLLALPGQRVVWTELLPHSHHCCVGCHSVCARCWRDCISHGVLLMRLWHTVPSWERLPLAIPPWPSHLPASHLAAGAQGCLEWREAMWMLQGCQPPASPSSHRIPIKLWISTICGSQSRPWWFPGQPWRLWLIWNLSSEDFPQRPLVPSELGVS